MDCFSARSSRYRRACAGSRLRSAASAKKLMPSLSTSIRSSSVAAGGGVASFVIVSLPESNFSALHAACQSRRGGNVLHGRSRGARSARLAPGGRLLRGLLRGGLLRRRLLRRGLLRGSAVRRLRGPARRRRLRGRAGALAAGEALLQQRHEVDDVGRRVLARLLAVVVVD